MRPKHFVKISALLLLIVGWISTSFMEAAWVVQGDSLNLDHAANPVKVCLPSSATGTAYAGWMEHDNFYVKAWDGSQWQQLGNALNTDRGFEPQFSMSVAADGTLYAAWREVATATSPPGIYVKRYNGNHWEPMGGMLNMNPAHLYANLGNLTCDGVIPYVTWVENQHIYVKRFVNGAWENAGPGLAGNYEYMEPYLVIWNHVPCVAYVSSFCPPIIHVYYLQAGNWVIAGGPLNDALNTYADRPCLAIAGGQLYATCREYSPTNGCYQLNVKSWDGDGWVAVGNGLNHVNPSQISEPILTVWHDQPMVSWAENGQGRICAYTGSSWEMLASDLHIVPGLAITNSCVAVINETPWIATLESNGTSKQVRVQKFHEHLPTTTLTATVTVTIIPTATAITSITPIPTEAYFTATSTPPAQHWWIDNRFCVYPNPARDRMNFAITLNGADKIVIDIYKFSGERVAHIAEHRDGGPGQTLTTAWEAAGVAPGIYLCRIVVTDGSGREVMNVKRKVALIK